MHFASRPEITFRRVELTYFKSGGADEVFVKDIRPVTSVRKEKANKKASAVRPEGIEIETVKKPAAVVKIPEEISIEPEAFKEPPQEWLDPNEAPEGSRLRDDYYLRVREKIKSVLDKNKKGFAGEGELHVRFIVERSGALKNLTLYRRYGRDIRKLGPIALNSIKEAAPFPPFTSEMRESELIFKLPIRFSYK
ncbi:MAG: hypothetical protein ISS26_03920 [Candidatus Omnitrophica bacterium]|nr:hypothetical protein [Candidatus Omnitrophota bacterium]